MPLDSRSINTALTAFYQKHGFGEELGKRPPLTVKVYTGCMLVPLPNIETRRKYLKYHDLHHILTGYSVGRIGEGKVSSWELGTGTFYQYPMLGLMNIIALSTGLFLKREDMWNAFLLGKQSRNLYSKSTRESVDSEEINLDTLRSNTLACRQHNPNWLTKFEFAVYSGIALFIHALIVLPAIAVRTVSDLISSGSIIETLKPKTRSDLY